MALIWSRIVSDNGVSLSIVTEDGVTISLREDHPSFNLVTLKLAEGAPDCEILELAQPVKRAGQKLQRLSERITFDGASIRLDGDPIENSLGEYIVGLLKTEGTEEAISWEPFVAFLEKLAQNTNMDSRESLFDFIRLHGLTIRTNGDFIAYKGVDNNLKSIHKGRGVVDGVEMKGALPNKPGSVLEVSRSYVDSDRAVGCSTGLHAGTMNYASNWGPTVVAVAINPRDVVSVPLDSNFQKLRVARYEVLVKVSERTENARATVGANSAPIWSGDTVNDEVAKLFKRAADEGLTLTFDYKGKQREAFVRRVDYSTAHTLVDGEHRSFSLHEIDSATIVEPKTVKVKVRLDAAPVGDFSNFTKKLEKAMARDAKVKIKYRSGAEKRSHTGRVHELFADRVLLRFKLDGKRVYRSIRFANIEDISIK